MLFPKSEPLVAALATDIVNGLTTYAEDTIQGAIESSTIRSARSLLAGRTKVLNRVAGNAIMVKLSNSIDEKAWAIESLVAEVEVIGRTRKNQL